MILSNISSQTHDALIGSIKSLFINKPKSLMGCVFCE